jgi:hypothetical protein
MATPQLRTSAILLRPGPCSMADSRSRAYDRGGRRTQPLRRPEPTGGLRVSLAAPLHTHRRLLLPVLLDGRPRDADRGRMLGSDFVGAGELALPGKDPDGLDVEAEELSYLFGLHIRLTAAVLGCHVAELTASCCSRQGFTIFAVRLLHPFLHRSFPICSNLQESVPACGQVEHQ